MSDFEKISDIITHASRLAQAGDWQALDEWVRDFDYVHSPPVMIVAVLRSTFAMREKLFFWQDAVNRARLHVGDETLRGLF